MNRFHFSLNVADLKESVAFYQALFGVVPSKLRDDYAKFETEDPPLVVSLEPMARPTGGPLNHLGVRLPDVKSLVEMQGRLTAAGLHSQREEGVECCYAKQTKFWLHDPDNTLWEFYTLDGDIEHRGEGQSEEEVMPRPNPIAAPAVPEPVEWEHRMGDPVPEAIPLADASAKEVRLRGTLNLKLGAGERDRLLDEVGRVLKPGGRLFVHVLTGTGAVDSPELPGPAGAVRHVPSEVELLAALEHAGLVGTRLLKFGSKPCFVRDGVEMRETQMEAFRPSGFDDDDGAEVMYLGPFDSVRVGGHEFERGVRATVSQAIAGQLIEAFTVFERRTLVATGDACGG